MTNSDSRTDRRSSPTRRRSPWRPLPVVALGLAVATAGAGAGPVSAAAAQPVGSARAAASATEVTLHIGDQAGSGAEALLKAANLLDKLPFTAAWSDFTSGPPILQAEAAGSIDIGGVGDAPPVFAAAGGAKIAVVLALRTDPNAAALLVPKGSAITSVSQLKGKTIAVAQGSSADYHLLAVLTKAGLSVHDVTIDYLQPAEGLAALASGKVDAWDVWTPFIEEAEAKDGARELVNGTPVGSTYSFVVASRSALANPAKRAAIGAYLSTIEKAYLWERTHTSSWATTWAAATGLPLSIMGTATKDDIQAPLPITPAVISSEQGIVDAFYGAGLIPTKVNFANFAYTGFNSLLSRTN